MQQLQDQVDKLQRATSLPRGLASTQGQGFGLPAGRPLEASTVKNINTQAVPDGGAAGLASTQGEEFVPPAGPPLEASTLKNSNAQAVADGAAAAVQGSTNGQSKAHTEDIDTQTLAFGAGSSHVPGWYHNGHTPSKSDITFEYQSAIGRDGYEPNPIQPNSEFFGPFRIDYKEHTIYLEDWNFAIEAAYETPGWGNLIVGDNNDWLETYDSAILGEDNKAIGEFNFVGGRHNVADGIGATVAGGEHNLAQSEFATLMGGRTNNVTAPYGVVDGGFHNGVSAAFASVKAGMGNVADGFYSSVVGGMMNVAMANSSSVLGGHNNTVPDNGVAMTVVGGDSWGWDKEIAEPPEKVEAGEQATDVEQMQAKIGCDSLECMKEFARQAALAYGIETGSAAKPHYESATTRGR